MVTGKVVRSRVHQHNPHAYTCKCMRLHIIQKKDRGHREKKKKDTRHIPGAISFSHPSIIPIPFLSHHSHSHPSFPLTLAFLSCHHLLLTAQASPRPV
nr:MAG TPA: hypothetical protein [Caudoviricetes sp.]